MRIAGIAFLAVCSFIAAPAPAAEIAGGKPIKVLTEPVDFFRVIPSRNRFGKLTWRGGIVLESTKRGFGGFSGLEISADGKRIIAVSDQGWWLSAKLNYDEGALTGVAQPKIAPLLTRKGKRSRKKSRRDAEALAAFDGRKIDGPLLIGFERRERMELVDLSAGGFKSKPREIAIPKAISSGPRNGELEALVRLWEGPYNGWYLAVSEKNFDKFGNIRGWRWKDNETFEFIIDQHEDYRITDIAVLPGGQEVVTLERSFSTGSLPGLALRRFRIRDLKKSSAAKGTILLDVRQPLYAIDNMEGLAVHKTKDGETRLTMISDDNYNRTVQSTLLFQFALDD